MDNVIKNYEEVLEKPPSTRMYLKFLKHRWETNRRYKKNNNLNKTEKEVLTNEPPEGIEIMSFAIVIDDTVVDVMHVQSSFGEVLQKGPQFIFIDKDKHLPHAGWVYKDEEFVSFEELVEKSRPTTRG